jgi:tetratricopeptide (TPR) repeat protein
LAAVYRRPLDRITADVRAWIERGLRPSPLVGAPVHEFAVRVAALTPFQVSLRLADLLLATGRLERAAAAFRELALQAPDSAEIPAALGTIALRQGERAAARRHWRAAIDRATTDASLCYRYALLADQAGLPAAEIRPALERALTLDPRFDDARYQLALLESNAGRYEAALAHFERIGQLRADRAHYYWSSVADALTQLGRRQEAVAAAKNAAQHAASAEERRRALQLAHMAQTELAVQFSRDSAGRTQAAAVRAPHGADWNPFVEPGDRIRRIEGVLESIDCAETTLFGIRAGDGLLKLAIPDPGRVQMRNAPAEFTCGPQPQAASVVVVYAAGAAASAEGVIRGVEFR